MGLIMLLGTVLLLIDNIERSFNAIWQVKKPRNLFRQITDYSSLILLLPVLLVVSSGLSIFMSTYVKELQNFMVLAPVLKFLSASSHTLSSGECSSDFTPSCPTPR